MPTRLSAPRLQTQEEDRCLLRRARAFFTIPAVELEQGGNELERASGWSHSGIG